MTKRKNQSEHDSMVRSIINYIKGEKHSSIRADLQGYEKPELIYWSGTKKGHYPDVTSTEGQNYIFEVETDDSINDSHTEDQWRLFSANAKEHSKTFIVVVSKGAEQQAQQRAKDLGINIDGVWTVG